MSNPGQNISIDEGMVGAASSTRRTLVILYYYYQQTTGRLPFFYCCCRLCDEDCSGNNCRPQAIHRGKLAHYWPGPHPGGYVGKIVVSLLTLMALPGLWYRFWLDNFYNTLALTKHVLETFSSPVFQVPCRKEGRRTLLSILALPKSQSRVIGIRKVH